MQQFGSVHVALAGYNAGDSRAAKWASERPGMPQDEFIDDIPFAETQNYVRRILGTADDYRRLYGGAEPRARPTRRQGRVAEAQRSRSRSSSRPPAKTSKATTR